MESSTGAVIVAIASAAAIIITALRKRKDADVLELKKRVDSLAGRVNHLEGALESTQRDLITAERHRFVLRRVLAQHNIPDPTLEVS